MTNPQDARVLFLLLAASALACSKGGATAEEPSRETDDASSGDPLQDVRPSETPPTLTDESTPGRPKLTSEECQARGGEIIGDIGDGRIYEEAYMCPSGEVPIGNVVSNSNGPTAVEGAVCCP